ncbi:MAG: hypothetical protein ACR2NU_09690 [Aeoliella sp.]
MVVLHNGNVLIGQVDLLGDAYRVATGASEIRLSLRDVERVVGSLLEAYEAKRKKVRANSADDHLRLAAWCVRQEMWPQAARELNDARQLDSRHPAIPLVARRLQISSRAAMRESQPPTKPDAIADQQADEHRARELQELESFAASLPPGSLEDFTRQVQPILVNGCAAAGCHSMDDEQKLRLNRDLLRGIGNRESTLRNLAAVWEEIDHEHADYSPLVMQPSVPHGGLARPVFSGQRQNLQQRIVEWVRTATMENDRTVESAVDLVSHEQPAVSEVDPSEVSAMDAMGDESPHFWEVGPDGTTTKPRIQRGVTLKQFEPRDEFDPEIFNRRQSSPHEYDPTQQSNPSSPAPGQ